jgi:uncharacterized protein with GYD domain
LTFPARPREMVVVTPMPALSAFSSSRFPSKQERVAKLLAPITLAGITYRVLRLDGGEHGPRREMAKKFGVTAKEIYWTLGSYDTVSIFEAPDDASIAALQASIGALGNVRTLTLRAFSQADMNGILAKLGKQLPVGFQRLPVYNNRHAFILRSASMLPSSPGRHTPVVAAHRCGGQMPVAGLLERRQNRLLRAA